ncbi:hypothetical protein [Halosimplex salinum]|uniref:hypothetical protein n=1 Tax=Halosimplex salinum TaxID=1710538 RepID=UPI000F4A99E7|nr:hypothetical protein [Halosimplex salinum]
MDDGPEAGSDRGESGVATRRSLLDRLGEAPPPDSTRERFWNTVCRFAPFFYLLLLVVTVFLIMNVLVLALVPGASVSPGTQQGSLVVVGINFALLGPTALGVGFVLWRCQRLSASN